MKTSDPAANVALVIFAALIGTVLVAAGAVLLLPIVLAFVGWRIYLWYSRLPMKTAEVLQTASVTAGERAPFPSTNEFLESHLNHLFDLWEENLPHYDLYLKLSTVAQVLYEDEEVAGLPPMPVAADDIAQARYRDKLLAYIKKTQEMPGVLTLLNKTIADSFSAFVAALSPIARTGTASFLPERAPKPYATVPLLDVIPSVGKAITLMAAAFYSQAVIEKGLFRKLRKKLDQNLREADPKKELLPEHHKGDAEEIVGTYLHDTPLIRLFSGSVPFNPPEETRYSGHWICASQGKGKTTLLVGMALQDFEKDASVIIIDSKGDLIAEVGNLKRYEDRYVVIDPRYTGINPIDVDIANITQATERLEYVFSALLEAKITPLQSVLFRNVLRALVEKFPNPTLATFQDILLHGYEPYRPYIDTLRTDLRDFFYKQYNLENYRTRRNEVLSRLDLLLTSDPIRNMMLVAKSNFSIAEEMDAGKIIIINNSAALLGEQGSEFLGRYFLSQIWAAATARSGRTQEDKKPCYLYVDEAHRIIRRDEKVSQIIDECRSQKLATIWSHQRLDQIESANVLSALANCAIRYANTDVDDRALAPRLRTIPAFIHSLRIGQFAAFVRDLTPKALAISVIQADTRQMPKGVPPKPAQEPEPVSVQLKPAPDVSPSNALVVSQEARRSPASDSEGGSEWR
jgi:hypothetical protein